MIRLLRDLSIRRKLELIIMLSSGVALVAACLAFVLLDGAYQRRAMLRSQRTLAEIVASHTVSALVFDDVRVAEENLAALRAKPQVVEAGVYTPEGELFARYMRSDRETSELPERAPPDALGFREDRLVVVQGIYLDGERVGTLCIRSDLRELRALLVRQLATTALVLLACLLLALLLGSRLQVLISRPITSLAQTARAFSVDQNYGIRASKHADDELGVLVDSFNEMLARIEGDVQLRNLNEELKRERDNVEAAARARTQFLANMSHEIRTPMTAILGYIDLLCDPETAESGRVICIDTIRRNGEHLLAIINDILDLSKIEAGKLVVEKIPCSVLEIVTDVAGLMRVRALERDLDFGVEFDGAIPETIRTDPTRLRQILLNLLGNAIKFTREGSVRMVVGLVQSPSDAGPQLRFEVIDTGIGLRYEQVVTIFDPFAQADPSTARRFGGTGLGLAISKRLADTLGGGISVASREGVGSTFTLVIDTGPLDGVPLIEPAPPAELAEAWPARPRPSPPVHLSGSVLLAEDGPDNQRLIRAFLTRAGLEVEVAENGRTAVARALECWEAGTPFDVILMDMHMPELDGYEATASLREAGYEGPIIALSAKAMKGNREECLAAGCDEYASKPIDREALLELVARFVRGSARLP